MHFGANAKNTTTKNLIYFKSIRVIFGLISYLLRERENKYGLALNNPILYSILRGKEQAKYSITNSLQILIILEPNQFVFVDIVDIIT